MCVIMKLSAKIRQLKRRAKRLFGPTDMNNTRIRHKDDYFKHYYFPKKLCDGIEWVAEIERSSRQVAVVKLMKIGIARYMRELINKQIEMDRIARGNNLRPPMTRYARLIRKYAKENGLNIKDIIYPSWFFYLF